MMVGSDVLYFTSDTVTYNNTVYYYVKNIQGDVIAILDTDGDAVVQYTYDAWGNILTTTGELATTLGAVNPLRYRGYVYDSETCLYYLQSRYYDPEVGRFLNADAFASTGQGILGNNMFAYCNNNPVNCSDPNGEVVSLLPTIVDYYWMHKYVQYDIAEDYGYAIEVYVVGSKGVGRLDLYDGESNEYYEVKHNLAATGESFENQMEKYDASHVVGWRFSEYTIEGNVTRGDTFIYGSTKYKYWDIQYWKAADGVIIYVWRVNEARYAQYVALLASAAMVAVGHETQKQGGAPQRVTARAFG